MVFELTKHSKKYKKDKETIIYYYYKLKYPHFVLRIPRNLILFKVDILIHHPLAKFLLLPH